MTPQEICSLSQALLDKTVALKKEFDLAFENLLLSGSKADLDITEGLRSQLEQELYHSPIAWIPEQISDGTRVYAGKLEPGIFQRLPETIEQIYAAFPERQVRLEELQIGGQGRQQLFRLLESHTEGKAINGLTAVSVVAHKDFATLEKPEVIRLAHLSVADLGFQGEASVDQIFDRALELGLEFCPTEASVHYFLNKKDKLSKTPTYIGMKPIVLMVNPVLLYLGHKRHDMALESAVITPNWTFDDKTQFLFRLPKKV